MHTQHAPEWARAQRDLIARQDHAAVRYLRRYTRSDGTFRFRRHWPGMDGSDDAYEGIQALPLLYALGGADWLLPTAHRLWLGTSWQFDRHGQVHRWFDGYYDWMHHGESSLVLYYLALADPQSLVQRDQALRFAAMYNGEDAQADNWDPQRRMIRSPFNGSRGPRYELTAEDWSTHREVLSGYHPPFEDLPGQELNTACSWMDDRNFDEILKRCNERWTRGDVPLNLTATTLGAHAFLWTGDDKYRRWSLDYLDAWMERAERNGGLCPDNVGPNDRVGEFFGGKWWGGYYGWWWPHGPQVVLEAITIACANAAVLDSDPTRMDFARRQLDLLLEHAREVGGRLVVPNRHGVTGWGDYEREYSTVIFQPRAAIAIWEITRSEEDAKRVQLLIGPDRHLVPSSELGKGNLTSGIPYFRYRQGENPDYPQQALAAADAAVAARLATIDADATADENMDMHHWQLHNPVVCEPLVQTSMGASMNLYHGGLLHAPVRHFDGASRRPGLPPDVAVLVDDVRDDRLRMRVVNTGTRPRHLIVQAGGLGEHRFGPIEPDGGGLAVESRDGGAWLSVHLAPAQAGSIAVAVQRYARTPSYASPVTAASAFSVPIVPREINQSD